MPIQRLVAGLHRFQAEVFRGHREFFERLAQGQSPETLFITCSDSRIDPNLITNTEPGDLFVLRNAGNIVPPYDPRGLGGEAPTIEFAVVGLGVKDVVVCGHSHCGAMKGLLHPENLVSLPTVAAWLEHAEATRKILWDCYQGCGPDALLDVATEENVLVQLDNLKSHPCVAERLAAGTLKLHGWIYQIESGVVYAYDPVDEQFKPLFDSPETGGGAARLARLPTRLRDAASGDGVFLPEKTV
ncbi:MAG: carbonic anhydrase [Planctomycetia bacterium]